MNKLTQFPKNKPIVCVQGLGFVGIAMATAIANAKDQNGECYFNVIGLDIDLDKINNINNGIIPVTSNDDLLNDAFKKALLQKNFFATNDPDFYKYASYVVVDINLDVNDIENSPKVNFNSLKSAIRVFASRIPDSCLVIVETTVPPGTCKYIVKPILEEEFENRKISKDQVKLAHSYERVMPGKDYYNSIINFWRVFAGESPVASKECKSFLEKIVNTKDFPLTELDSTVASETSKVLENSYRAMNIAFIEEWGKFAENAGINLFEVLDAIRIRPTHSNIRSPGLGVGGYCLTKDPLLAQISNDLFFEKKQDIDFHFSKNSVRVNNNMPIHSVNKLIQAFNGSIKNKNILLFGASYRPDVGDTRFSASEIFYRELKKLGANIDVYDPIVKNWQELSIECSNDLDKINHYDALVFAVGHTEITNLDFNKLSLNKNIIILDTNNVLTKKQIKTLLENKIFVRCIGRGDLS